MYSISYCISSKNLHLTHNEAGVTSDITKAFHLIDLLEDDDVIYVDLVETKDALNINGSENGGIFLEVSTARGGIFSKDMTISEVKTFLSNITVDFDGLDAMGFESSSI